MFYDGQTLVIVETFSRLKNLPNKSHLLDWSVLFSPDETIVFLQMRTFRGHMSLEVFRTPTNGPAPGTDEANHVTASLGKWLVAAALVLGKWLIGSMVNRLDSQ